MKEYDPEYAVRAGAIVGATLMKLAVAGLRLGEKLSLPGELWGDGKEEVLLTRKEAMDYLKVGQTKLRELREAGEIKVVMIGGRPKFPVDSLDKYLKKQQRKRE